MEFHILSFEGPDSYSRAGGIATRVTGMLEALTGLGYDAHLWFVGDPNLPGHETQGKLHLHRWCQWISQYHPGGVYQGEDAKVEDYSRSLPPFLIQHHLRDLAAQGERAVIIAEEWQTASTVINLHEQLRISGLRDAVTILWNANNTFGFDRIDWPRLSASARITTVSRYMRHLMQGMEVDATVLPNGLGTEAFELPDLSSVSALRHMFRDRMLLTKVARWDPDKRWIGAVEAVANLKRAGARPLLLARGGMEAHGAEVLARAHELGLDVIHRSADRTDAAALVDVLRDVGDADVICLRSHLDANAKRALFRGAKAVLANSSHEPFGLVGLEAMAAGGLALTGCTGEDYATPGVNAVVVQGKDPRELAAALQRVHADPRTDRRIRREARKTAGHYAWHSVLKRTLLPEVNVPWTAHHHR